MRKSFFHSILHCWRLLLIVALNMYHVVCCFFPLLSIKSVCTSMKVIIVLLLECVTVFTMPQCIQSPLIEIPGKTPCSITVVFYSSASHVSALNTRQSFENGREQIVTVFVSWLLYPLSWLVLFIVAEPNLLLLIYLTCVSAVFSALHFADISRRAF